MRHGRRRLGAILLAVPFHAVEVQEASSAPAVPVDAPAAEATPETAAVPGRTGSALVGEIVVTAQKREQSAQDVGISIAAFSGEALEELGVTDTRDLGNLVTGFTVSDSGFAVPIYTLRGVGFNELSQFANSTVGVYLDEVNLPYPSLTKGANLDLQRVEVLKGPQGTLYGRNTTGGAVNYIARRPTDTLEAGAQAGYASFDTTDVEAHVSGPLARGLRGRVAVRDVRSQEGWQRDYTRDDADWGKLDKQSGRALLDWDASDTVSVRLGFDGWLDQSEPQSPQYYDLHTLSPLPGTEPSEEVQNHPRASDDDAQETALNAGEDFYLDEKFWQATLRADWDVSRSVGGANARFTVLGALQRFRADDRFNADGVNATSIDYIQVTRTNAHNLEARLSGLALDDSLNYVAGYFHSQDSIADVRNTEQNDLSPTAGGLVINHAGTDGRQDSLTDAVFGQVEWQASEAFKTTLGLRYSRETRELAACSRDVDGELATLFGVLQLAQQLGLNPLIGAGLNNAQLQALANIAEATFPTNAPGQVLSPFVQQGYALGLAGLAAQLIGGPQQGECITLDSETAEDGLVEKSLKEDNLSGRAALDWTPADRLRFYASFSVGYKSGSYTLVPASNDDQYDPVKQERVNAYEVGFKGRVVDDVQLNAAAFHYDYYDKQLFTYFFDQVFGAIQKLANVPRSRVDGVELEVQYTPRQVSGLFGSVGLTYLDTEVEEYSGLGPFGEPDVDYAGGDIS
ncbi:MAG TPA: TonB-dependent receptor, partial [Nevskiaceae bacterium]|nr:TonB-dependent receptor [Nevskiaceae bacterium]